MPSEQEILAALRATPGPDGTTPLPDANVIEGLSIHKDKIYLSLKVPAAQAKDAEKMRAAAETIILGLEGVEGAAVTLTADKPPQPEKPKGQQTIPGVARIVAVASGKGGVGKSTTAANIAAALAAEGWRVGLLDADIYGPSVPRLFGLNQRPMAVGDMLVPLEAHGVKLMSIGFMVEERTAMVWRGPMVMSALVKLLREVAWGQLDCLVVDMPPGTGDAQLTMAQSVPLSGAVIVSTPQDLALIDARRGISMFEQVAVPVLGVVENMSYFQCPKCGERTDVFGHGGAQHEAETLHVPFLGAVPLELAIRRASDDGQPIVATQPDAPQARIYRDIARKVKAELDKTARAAPKIVIE